MSMSLKMVFEKSFLKSKLESRSMLLKEIEFFGQFSLPSFYIVASLCACLALWLSIRRAPLRRIAITQALDTCLIIMIGVFIGARVFHVLLEAPLYYLDHPVQILQPWMGGFVYWGGFLGGLLAGFLWVWQRDRQNWLQYFDHFAPILSLITAFGRVGCFLNGCCYGKTCDLPWAIMAHDEQGVLASRHPTQLYLAFGELFILGVILLTETKISDKRAKPLQLFGFWLVAHSILRFVVEFYRADDRGFAWHLSQGAWLSLAAAISGGAILLFCRGKNQV